MLTTGIRTPVGVKIFGSDLTMMEKVGVDIERELAHLEGTRSVYAERVAAGHFLDINFNRAALAQHGISMAQAHEAISIAVGGEPLSMMVEGRERYSINARYGRDFRSSPDDLKRVLIATSAMGVQVPLGEVANIEMVSGPSMIRDEIVVFFSSNILSATCDRK